MTAALLPGAATERELPAVPALGGLYRRAASAAARAALSRRLGRTPALPDHLPDVAYRVDGVRADRDRLTAYQHLLDEPANDVLPAGYVHVLAFPVAIALMARDDFPLPLLGTLHLANRVEQHRPVRVDERLTVRVGARDLRPHRRGTEVDLVTDVSVDGELAWHGVSTYLATGVHAVGTPAADDSPRPEFVPPQPTGRWRYDADRGRRYAAVSGDANPIHLAGPTAKAFGFPRAIAHGMDTAARALAAVGAARGDAFRWDVELGAPVLLPSTPAVRVARDPDGSGAFGFTVWDPRRRRPHLQGTVAPLG